MDKEIQIPLEYLLSPIGLLILGLVTRFIVSRIKGRRARIEREKSEANEAYERQVAIALNDLPEEWKQLYHYLCNGVQPGDYDLQVAILKEVCSKYVHHRISAKQAKILANVINGGHINREIAEILAPHISHPWQQDGIIPSGSLGKWDDVVDKCIKIDDLPTRLAEFTASKHEIYPKAQKGKDSPYALTSKQANDIIRLIAGSNENAQRVIAAALEYFIVSR